jgi:hypothetical protein
MLSAIWKAVHVAAAWAIGKARLCGPGFSVASVRCHAIRTRTRATKVVIAATAVALNIAVECRSLVGVCIVDRISGGLREFGSAFDGRLGTTVVLHAGEKRRVVLVATGILDRGWRRALTPAFASRELPLDLLSNSGSFALPVSAEYGPLG